jgi:cytochrome c
MNISIRKTLPANFAAMAAVGFAIVFCMTIAMAAADTTSQGEAIAKGSDCFSCHANDQKIVGPAFTAVAAKFAGQPNAEATLSQAIANGHVGTWGTVPMPAHPQLSSGQISQIVTWILSLKTQASSGAAASKQYTYTANGKTVTTDFPIFLPQTTKVTPEVFHGYEIFNSYCFRCHGADALGGSYAPNLRASLNNGMTEDQFISIAMVGRKAQGMPSWAGFFTPQDVQAIYQYVKARSLAVVDVGIPPE